MEYGRACDFCYKTTRTSGITLGSEKLVYLAGCCYIDRAGCRIARKPSEGNIHLIEGNSKLLIEIQ